MKIILLNYQFLINQFFKSNFVIIIINELYNRLIN